MLGQLNIFVLLKQVLQVQLEDGPQALDGIELGTVRRKEQKFDVELLSQLTDVDSPMRWVVVNH